jgi:hypothetical protein
VRSFGNFPPLIFKTLRYLLFFPRQSEKNPRYRLIFIIPIRPSSRGKRRRPFLGGKGVAGETFVEKTLAKIFFQEISRFMRSVKPVPVSLNAFTLPIGSGFSPPRDSLSQEPWRFIKGIFFKSF